MKSVWMALGLVLIIEGLMPFLAPSQWREMIRKAMTFHDGQIRFIGFAAISCGLMILLLLQ